MDDNQSSTLPAMGDAAAHGGGSAALGTGAVIIWNDIANEGRDQFYRWHDHEHIPERLAIPGFLRGRRYGRRGHSPEYLTLYEAENPGIVASPAYLARLNAPTPLTRDTIQYFRNTSRAVCRIAYTVGSSGGGHILTLRIELPEPVVPAEAGTQGVRVAEFRALVARLFDRALKLNGVVACHLYEADQSASRINTAESAKRAIDVPSWIVLVEASLAAPAEAARALFDGPELAALGGSVRPDAAVYALEICRLAQPVATV